MVELRIFSSALAAGGDLQTILAGIREREERLHVIASSLQRIRAEARGLNTPPFETIMPEVRRRLEDWRGLLSEESKQARQMLRSLLVGRLVFTPDFENHACDFTGQGDLGGILKGLVTVP